MENNREYFLFCQSMKPLRIKITAYLMLILTKRCGYLMAAHARRVSRKPVKKSVCERIPVLVGWVKAAPAVRLAAQR
jgi:hypothetical protein